MNQFDTILVPLDGSLHDDIAITTALSESLRHNARLALMYVIEQPETAHSEFAHGGPSPVDAVGGHHSPVEEQDAASNYLDEVQHKYHLFANVETVVRTGDPVHQIEREAESRERPLVVLAIEPGSQQMQQSHVTRASRLMHRGRVQLMLVTPIEDSPRVMQVKAAAPWNEFAMTAIQ